MKNQNRDNARELRRALNNARRASDGAWARMADELRANARPHFIAKATAPCDAAVSVAVEVVTPIEGQVEIGDTLTAANVYESPTQYARVPRNQKLVVVRGDHPRWQPNTGYAGGDFVTHDNGGGLKRWERNSSGTSGATFDAGDWTELEAATGWRIGFLFEHIARGTATSGHDALDGKSFDATIDDAGTPIALTDVANPLLQDVATDDKVLICFWGQDLADVANAPFLVLSQSSLGGGGGGGGGGDELVASQSGQTANYLSAVLVDAPAQTAPWYAVDMVLSGATMYGRVNVPTPSNNRLVRGTTTAAVKHSDASYQMATPVGLADGDTPAGSPITVHAPIASYESGATVWAIRDQANTRWIDATPARFTAVKAQTTGAVSYGADGWTVDNIELLAGGRLPGSVTGNAALRNYRNDEWVYLWWNDENQRWEDFTPLQFRMISYLTKGAVANGAANFTVDNVVALCGGANPAASSSTEVTVYGASQAYADNAPGFAVWNDSAQQFVDFSPPPVYCKIGVVATGSTITARSGLTAGKGSVDIYEIDTSDDSLDDKAVANETWYNLATEEIAEGKFVMGKPVQAKDGTTAYFVDWEQCDA